ncbi:MAG: Maf family nucleotide pyrophosphatase [Rikenellaceae bacterium]|jgi:septum formation protein|nr:Maf family nucleotide pyrophosphatase [Rikenellaceae bacterium]
MLLPERLKNYRLILASQSPRRRRLMADAEMNYTLAENYDLEEIFPKGMVPKDVPVYLAELKSAAYPKALAADEILVTADTIVIVDGEVIGKPDGREGAIRMLGKLSGRRHEVITGVTLRNPALTKNFAAHSAVFFRTLNAEEIAYYVDRYRPFDKAGAYGIQEWIGYVGIERIEGSFYNVMGLPVQMLYVELSKMIDQLENKP